MREQILLRLESNIGRVRNLVLIYRNLVGVGQGRRPVHATDILRSAVVLLHATLEDVLRSIADWKFPALGEEALNDVSLVGHGNGGRPEKFFLGKLAVHRGKTVQALIEESVRGATRRMSFNSVGDVAALLQRVGLDAQQFAAGFPVLETMIERRHHIVHQADRNDHPGVGHFRARSLSVATVNGWTEQAEATLRAIVLTVPGDLV